MDSMRNFLAGFGLFGRDKAASQQFVWAPLDRQQLESAYRGDWLARKIVDIPAFDSCRQWRQWEAENDQIELLEEAARNFMVHNIATIENARQARSARGQGRACGRG